MAASYLKQAEEDKKYKNRDENADDCTDPEFQRYLHERNNTLKMSTILKTLNSPRKKRKTVTALRVMAEKEFLLPEGKRCLSVRSRNEFSSKFRTTTSLL